MKFCTKCGKENESGLKFCIGCGAAISGGSQNSTDSYENAPEHESAHQYLSPLGQTQPATKVTYANQQSSGSINLCSKCGKQNESGIKFCTTCGAATGGAAQNTTNMPRDETTAYTSQQFYANPPTHQGQPHPQSAPAYVHQQTIMNESMIAIKQTFSKNPEAAIETAINARNKVWLVLGGVYVLLSAVFARMLVSNVISGALGAAEALMPAMVRRFIDDLLSGMFMYGLLFAAASLFVFGACMLMLFSIFKINIPFSKVMDVTAASSLIASAILAAAIIISFISTSGAFVLGILVAPVAPIIMLYRGIQKTAKFESSPFWVYMGLTMVSIAVLNFISSSFILPAVTPDLFGDFWDETFGGLSAGLLEGLLDELMWILR